jgi:hypothetical protein
VHPAHIPHEVAGSSRQCPPSPQREELFATKVKDGILGSPVGVYRYEDGEIVVDGVVRTPLPGAR